MSKVPPAKGRNYRGVNPDQRKQNRREAFIEAGIELFGSKGYRACSVKMVCDQVNLTERYFYESFNNREALLSAVFQALAMDLDRQLRAVIEDPALSSGERLDGFLKTFFKFVRNSKRGRVLIFEILGVSPEVDVVYQAAVRNLATLLEHPHLALFQVNGKTSAESRHILSIGLVGAMVQLANTWILEKYKSSRKTMMANTLEIFKAVSMWEQNK